MTDERSRDLYDRALSVMPGGVNSAVRAAVEPYPFFVERGDGGHVIDADEEGVGLDGGPHGGIDAAGHDRQRAVVQVA